MLRPLQRCDDLLFANGFGLVSAPFRPQALTYRWYIKNGRIVPEIKGIWTSDLLTIGLDFLSLSEPTNLINSSEALICAGLDASVVKLGLPEGDAEKRLFQLSFNGSLRIEFHLQHEHLPLDR